MRSGTRKAGWRGVGRGGRIGRVYADLRSLATTVEFHLRRGEPGEALIFADDAEQLARRVYAVRHGYQQTVLPL